jgi:hypothetical protein
MSGPSGSPPTSAYDVPASKLPRAEIAASAGVTATDASIALSSDADLAAFDLDGAITVGNSNSGHVDCGNQILVDETNEDMTTRMLARLSEDSNRR